MRESYVVVLSVDDHEYRQEDEGGRSDEQQGVDAVEDAAVAGQKLAAVFHVKRALQQ